LGEYARAATMDEAFRVAAVLPWDVANHPAKERLWSQQPYLGLRAFLRDRMGLEVSPRSQIALRAFLNHVRAGDVLALDDAQGAHYVPQDPAKDGALVIRWPEGVPRDERVGFFEFAPGQRDGD
jgi:hypothetical protein